MATKRIQDLENVEEVLADSIIPVGEATKTKSMLVSQLKNWLSSFFVDNTGDEDIEGVKNFLSEIKTITPPSASNDKTIPNTEWVNSIILASMPVGTILPYGGSSAPSGFLLCNGATVSRTTYASLFTKIGTTYGAGDGLSTFALPNYSNARMVTSATIGVKGNGKTLGLTNGAANCGLMETDHYGASLDGNSYGAAIPSRASYSTPFSDGDRVGITTDSTKSGITGTASLASTCKFIIKY